MKTPLGRSTLCSARWESSCAPGRWDGSTSALERSAPCGWALCCWALDCCSCHCRPHDWRSRSASPSPQSGRHCCSRPPRPWSATAPTAASTAYKWGLNRLCAASWQSWGRWVRRRPSSTWGRPSLSTSQRGSWPWPLSLRGTFTRRGASPPQRHSEPSLCIFCDMIRSLLFLLTGVGPAPAPRPRRIVVITVDQLRPDYLERYRPQLKAAAPGARALSVSGKDRGAILPIGRAKEQVYWYSAGYFTTSRYYADSLPTWVRIFNGQRVPFRAAGTLWTLFLSERDYPEPDSASYENQGRDIVFPHRLPTDSGQAALAFIATPTMDSLTLAFALEGVRALQLGSRGATDLLAVSLSTTDYLGHAYGPDSREIHDQVVRLDRYLGRFLEQLFVRYGRNNVLVVLTADHGVTPYPERARALGHPGAVRVIPDTIIQSVNAALDQRAGGGDWLQFESGMLHLSDRPKLVAHDVNADSVVADVGTRLRALAGVARADRPAAFTAKDTADPVAPPLIQQVPGEWGVGLVGAPKAVLVWSYPNAPIATHGQPTELDAHVPLILWGPGIRRGVYGGRVNTVDIAPTLARLLDLTPAEPLDGRVLTEALGAQN